MDDGDEFDAEEFSGELATMAQTANRLHEMFDSALIIASAVKDGKTYWFTVQRGNDFATEALAARYARGQLTGGLTGGPEGFAVH